MPALTFDAVLFDGDGVLVDSEPITNGVLRDMLEERGWKLGAEECMRVFVGKVVLHWLNFQRPRTAAFQAGA